MLCYVGHHDPADECASRGKIETLPITGAAQLRLLSALVGTGTDALFFAADLSGASPGTPSQTCLALLGRVHP